MHGEFLQTPQSHWTGSGCNECGRLKTANSRRKTKEKFIEEARLVHGDEYDYYPVEYEEAHKKSKFSVKKTDMGFSN